MNYQRPNPSPITYNGQSVQSNPAPSSVVLPAFPPGIAFPVTRIPSGHGIQPSAVQPSGAPATPKARKAARAAKEDNATTEKLYFDHLMKSGNFAVRDGVLHRWNGVYWTAIDAEEGIAQTLAWLVQEHVERVTKSAAKSCFETACGLMPKMPKRDTNRTLIPVRNVYLEVLQNGDVVRHKPDPSYGITFALAIGVSGAGNKYVPAPLPASSLFAKFLHSSLPDVSVQDYLQELMGDTLTPSMKFQTATLLKGGGRNGKSVLIRLMSALHEHVAPMRLDRLSDFNLMPLLVGSLVIVEEVPAVKFDEQTMKSLLSGDPVTINRKYLSPVSYRPTAKWILSTNNDQRSRDNSTGFWRRLAIVPFTQQIDAKAVIPGLDQDIIDQELRLVLDWCLTGLQRLVKRGTLPPEPAAVVAAKQRAIVASNPVAAWVQEEGVTSGVDQIDLQDKGDVFNRYCRWCSKNRQRVMTSGQFWTALRAQVAISDEGQHRVDGQRHRYVLLRFTSDTQLNSPSGLALSTPFDAA